MLSIQSVCGLPRLRIIVTNGYKITINLTDKAGILQYVAEERVSVDGFTVLYRCYDDNLSNYSRHTVDGSSTDRTVLRQLDSDTAYSIVMRSFNRHGDSQLSNTVVMATLASAAAPRFIGLIAPSSYLLCDVYIDISRDVIKVRELSRSRPLSQGQGQGHRLKAKAVIF